MDVIGIGALNLDHLYSVNKLAKTGGHQWIKNVSESPGGSAANTIVGLARIGFKTGFIGALGNDSAGKIMLSDFRKNSVNTSRVRILNGKTGSIIGFVDSVGERTMYVYPGVNDELGLNREDIDYISKSKLLHMSSFVNEKQFKIQKNLVKKIPEKIKVGFSPSDLYAKKGLDALKSILKKCYVIFLNESEIKTLTDQNYTRGSKTLLDYGVKIIAVTLGEKGCYIRTKDACCRINAIKTKVVDTTGAGDVFSAGFLAGLLKNKSLEDCGILGNKMASLCVRKFGARTWLSELVLKG